MSVEGSGESLSAKNRQLYEQEYKHGANLFQRALQDDAQSDNIYKKAELKGVMNTAMEVMNQTVHELKRQDLDTLNQKIAVDYKTYRETGNPTTLEQDLQQAQNIV